MNANPFRTPGRNLEIRLNCLAPDCYESDKGEFIRTIAFVFNDFTSNVIVEVADDNVTDYRNEKMGKGNVISKMLVRIKGDDTKQAIAEAFVLAAGNLADNKDMLPDHQDLVGFCAGKRILIAQSWRQGQRLPLKTTHTRGFGDDEGGPRVTGQAVAIAFKNMLLASGHWNSRSTLSEHLSYDDSLRPMIYKTCTGRARLHDAYYIASQLGKARSVDDFLEKYWR